LVREALEENGVEGDLVVLTDGEKAVQYLDAIDAQLRHAPDLFIIDLNLPKKSGREVLERMHLVRGAGHPPVIVLSSSNAYQDMAEAARLGASLYIRKPTRLQEFMSIGAIFKQKLGQ
jgi:DNA-binding response OmpR family regulator